MRHEFHLLSKYMKLYKPVARAMRASSAAYTNTLNTNQTSLVLLVMQNKITMKEF